MRIPAAEAETVFDEILPRLPGGLHLREDGDAVELRVLEVPGTPPEEELRALAGESLIEAWGAEVSDDWRERRLGRYRPLVVAERFLLRPDWAPAGADDALVEIVLEQAASFGTGVHPTTQACLAAMAEVEAGGSFADVGCGSGVLSIAAARLGWSPVLAVDLLPASVATARRNADRNDVEIEVRRMDVTSQELPEADTMIANIPPDVQVAFSKCLGRAPSLLLASGFHHDEIPQVAGAWEARGLRVTDEVRANEWSLLVMR